MDVFCEVEFTPDKYGEIEKVLYILTNDGWHVYKETHFKVKNQLNKTKSQSKKYYLRRGI